MATATQITPAPPDAASPGAGVAAIAVRDLRHAYPVKTRKPRRGKAPIEGQATTHGGVALDGVTFDVRAGEIFGVLGPNGSGKTTLFRVLSTILNPDSGAVSIFGRDVLADPRRVRELLGVVFQMPSLDGKLTATENLVCQGNLYGLSGADLIHRCDELLGRFGLSDRRDDFVERFSGGMRRRVELAKALLHEPRMLLLDEPATGLDPGARLDVWQHLERLRAERGMTVVLTTHLMDEADRCDRLAVMAHGKIVALGTPAQLKARIGGDVITIDPDPAGGESATRLAADIEQRFAPWPKDIRPAAIDGKVRVEKPDGAAFVATLAAAFPGRIRSITVGRPTLEDVFMHLTGHTLWEER